MQIKVKDNDPEKSIILKKLSFRAPPKRRTIEGIFYTLWSLWTLNFLLTDINGYISYFMTDYGLIFLIMSIIIFLLAIFFLIDITRRIKREELILSFIKEPELIMIYNQNISKDIYLQNNVEVVLLQEHSQKDRQQFYKVVLRHEEEEIVLGFWKSITSEWILNLTKMISENLEIPYKVENFITEDLDLPPEII